LSKYINFKKKYILEFSGYEIFRLREYLKNAVVRAKDIEVFNNIKDKIHNIEENIIDDNDNDDVDEILSCKEESTFIKNIRSIKQEEKDQYSDNLDFNKDELKNHKIHENKNKIIANLESIEKFIKKRTDEVIEIKDQIQIEEDIIVKDQEEDQEKSEDYNEQHQQEQEDIITEEEFQSQLKKENDIFAQYRENMNTLEQFSEEKVIDELIPIETQKIEKKVKNKITNNKDFDIPTPFGVPKVGFKDLLDTKIK
jgi:hypothetical protein